MIIRLTAYIIAQLKKGIGMLHLKSTAQLVLFMFILIACSPAEKQTQKITAEDESAGRPLVTFIELGSVKCVPCKKMQPVMASIEQKYAQDLAIVFYDIWQEDQKHFAQEYNVRLIPTQVFLDSNGVEIMRHEGFFPEDQIEDFLATLGLTPKEVVEPS